MPPLKIDLNTVEQPREQHNKRLKWVSQLVSDVSSTTYRLDSAIRMRRSINKRLTDVAQRLIQVEQRMSAMSEVIRSQSNDMGVRKKS